MKKIVADTNFLMSQFECGVDLPAELHRIIAEPFSLVICSGTMDELRAIAGRTGKRASAARFVLNNFHVLRSKLAIEEVPSRGIVDEWIINFARANKIAVATNDVRLRQRLLGLRVKVIVMKGKSKLDFF